jgi:predicted 3-demethylubiquinone-9 3-methyltransferase (glyoxalase superfamily)
MPTITPFLWFDKEAEEAAKFYVSIFKKSKIKKVVRSPADTHSGPKGMVLVVDFTLNGQDYTAMNGGPGHPLTDAFSLVVNCKTQKEVDYYWKKLTAGGKEIACGWLVDKYGLSWQITPVFLLEMLKKGKDPKKVKRMFEAMMKMVKLDIKALKKAYAGQ